MCAHYCKSDLDNCVRGLSNPGFIIPFSVWFVLRQKINSTAACGSWIIYMGAREKEMSTLTTYCYIFKQCVLVFALTWQFNNLLASWAERQARGLVAASTSQAATRLCRGKLQLGGLSEIELLYY